MIRIRGDYPQFPRHHLYFKQTCFSFYPLGGAVAVVLLIIRQRNESQRCKQRISEKTHILQRQHTVLFKRLKIT